MLATQAPHPHKSFPQAAQKHFSPAQPGEDDLRRAYSRLAASGMPVKLAAAETLYLENDPATWCYEVLSGMIKESNTLLDGRCDVAGFIPPGVLFGLSHNGIHPHTAEALGETRLLRYSRKALDNAIAESPAFAQFVLHQMLHRLNRAEARMLALGRLTALERVAQFLLEFTEAAGAGRDPVRITVSRRDIADHIGLTTETICRCLTILRKERFIRMPSPHIVGIPDPERLRALIGNEDGAGLCLAA